MPARLRSITEMYQMKYGFSYGSQPGSCKFDIRLVAEGHRSCEVPIWMKTINRCSLVSMRDQCFLFDNLLGQALGLQEE